MLPRSSFLKIFIAILTVLAIVGGFSSFQRKRSSFERLDFQFHWQNGIVVVEHVDPNTGADRSGLKAGDQIWVVDNTPASEVDGLKRTLRRLDRDVSLLVARGNETKTITYRAPELKVEYPYLFLTFTGFLYLSIGLFTFFRGGRQESLLFYFVTLLSFIVYAYSPATGKIDTTFKALLLIEDLARILLPPLTLHFFLRFPRPLLNSRWTVAAIYTPPALVALWDANVLLFNNAIPFASNARSLLIIDRWQMLHFAVYFTLAFIALAYTYKTAAAVGQRKQIKWIFLGMGAGFIPFLILYLIPFIVKGVGSAYSSLAILPLAFIPLAFAVSILRYKLWDVEVVIREILAYTVTFVFGIIAFSTVNLILSRLIEEHFALERNFLAFASGLLIAGVLVPVKGRIESLIDMFVYRDTYRHRKAVIDFAQELATFHDLHELIEMVRERLAAAINLHQMNLYVREGAAFSIYLVEPGLPRRIQENDFGAPLPPSRPLILDEPHLPDPSEVAPILVRNGYRYVFPLRHRGELQGMLILGNKLEHEQLSRDDLHLIGSLTAPVALALENARLYGRLRRQLEEIRSLKEYNENIIESSSSAIVVVARDGTILTANNAFWTLVGTTPDTQEPIEVVFPPYRELDRSRPEAVQVHYTDKAGEEKELTVSASPFRAVDAPEGTIVVVIGDISERIRLERELQDKDRLAALGMLAAGVAHEVNTPLTGISSYAQLLLADTSPDDPRHEILKKMEQQTFRAAHLVNNLLNFARSSGRSHETVDLSELIKSTITMNENLLSTKEVQVTVKEMEPIEVNGDFYQLQQVLTNLLSNARDAVCVGGHVWIDVEQTDHHAILSVRDDGRGIPLEMQERIFQPLITTKSAQGGTGLGLAISQRIIQSHGGDITVTSAPKKGATFSISLPLADSKRQHN